jgi:hypothetical protein
MLTAVLKAVKMQLSYCTKNSQDADVLTALKMVQNTEKNHPHKDQVQRLIPITDEVNYHDREQLPLHSLHCSSHHQSPYGDLIAELEVAGRLAFWSMKNLATDIIV